MLGHRSHKIMVMGRPRALFWRFAGTRRGRMWTCWFFCAVLPGSSLVWLERPQGKDVSISRDREQAIVSLKALTSTSE